MPNIGNPGALYYPSGTELVPGFLTSSGTPLTLTTAYVNNPIELLATVEGTQVILPAANAAGVTSGWSHITGFIHQSSYPIQFRNAGNIGQEPTLEKVVAPQTTNFSFNLMSGTSGTLWGSAYSANAGVWGFQGTNPTIPGLVPLQAGVRAPSWDTGSVSVTSWASANNVFTYQTTWVSPTLGFFVFADRSNNIQGVPFQVNVSGQAAAVGAQTQIAANGGVVLQYPLCGRVTLSPAETRGLVSWYDPTVGNPRNLFAVVTISSGASVPTLSVGAVSNDTTAVAASGGRILTPGNSTSSFTLDGGVGPNLWINGQAIISSQIVSYYLSVVGTTVTVSGYSGFFASGYSYPAGGSNTGGIQPASISPGKLITFGNTGSSGFPVSGQSIFQLSYSAGAITVSGVVSGPSSVINQNYLLYPVDPTQGTFFVTMGLNVLPSAGALGSAWLLKLDTFPNPLKLIEASNYIMISDDGNPGWQNGGSPGGLGPPIQDNNGYLGDGEFVETFVENLNSSPPTRSTYFDVRSNYTTGITPGASGQMGNFIIGRSSRIQMTYGQIASGAIISGVYTNPGYVVEPLTRRAVMLTPLNTLGGSNFNIAFNFFEVPKR